MRRRVTVVTLSFELERFAAEMVEDRVGPTRPAWRTGSSAETLRWKLSELRAVVPSASATNRARRKNRSAHGVGPEVQFDHGWLQACMKDHVGVSVLAHEMVDDGACSSMADLGGEVEGEHEASPAGMRARTVR